MQKRSFELRKSLVLLRRVVLPMREVVNTVLRRDLQSIDPEMLPYFQDVYDHVLRATEWTESLRDLVTTILETNISIQGNRMNMIMKKVTSWAAIIAVPTAITGFFGQNLAFAGFGTSGACGCRSCSSSSSPACSTSASRSATGSSPRQQPGPTGTSPRRELRPRQGRSVRGEQEILRAPRATDGEQRHEDAADPEGEQRDRRPDHDTGDRRPR